MGGAGSLHHGDECVGANHFTDCRFSDYVQRVVVQWIGFNCGTTYMNVYTQHLSSIPFLFMELIKFALRQSLSCIFMVQTTLCRKIDSHP